MKFGVRKPSLRKSIAARTVGKSKRALKKAIMPAYGTKGMGIFHPIRSSYNKLYNKTTIGIKDIISSNPRNINKVQNDNSNNRAINSYAKTIWKEVNKLNTIKDGIKFFPTLKSIYSYIDSIKRLEIQAKCSNIESIKIENYINGNKDEIIKNFLYRFYNSKKEKIYSLKTTNAKINQLNNFKFIIEYNQNYLNSDNLEYANNLFEELKKICY